MKKMNLSAYALMPLLLIFWGSFAAISKLILSDMDSRQMQFWYFLTASVSTTVYALAKKKFAGFKKLSANDLRRLIFYALFLFLYYFLYIMALDFIPSVEASMINYLFPIFVVLLAVPINKEKLTAVKIISSLICFSGVLVIVTNGDFINIKITNLKGDLLALGAAVSWGLFSNFGKKNESDFFISNYVYILTAFVLSAAAMLIFTGFYLPGPAGFLGCFWLGLSNLSLSFPIWFTLLKKSSVSTAANLSFFTPLVNLLFISALTDERITYAALLGLALITAGNVLQSLTSRAR